MTFLSPAYPINELPILFLCGVVAPSNRLPICLAGLPISFLNPVFLSPYNPIGGVHAPSGRGRTLPMEGETGRSEWRHQHPIWSAP